MLGQVSKSEFETTPSLIGRPLFLGLWGVLSEAFFARDIGLFYNNVQPH